MPNEIWPEEQDELEHKIRSIIDAALYGGLDIETVVTRMLDLFEEQKRSYN